MHHVVPRRAFQRTLRLGRQRLRMITMANTSQHSLVLSVFVVCFVAIVIPSTVARKFRKGGGPGDESSPDSNAEVWTFHFEPLNSRLNYVDPISGEIKGLYTDVVNSVCEIADKNCRTVADISSNCWNSIEGQQVGGVGLFNFYYDACVGWSPTYDRLRTFQFTESIGPSVTSGFVVKSGNPDNFDCSELEGKTIGFVLGAFSDPSCVARQAENINGAGLSDENIVYYTDVAQCFAGVIAGEIDACFDITTNSENNVEVDFIDDCSINCAVGGPALMMRKDNPLKSWWDPALEELVQSPKYQMICDNLENVHGALPGPNGAEYCVTQ